MMYPTLYQLDCSLSVPFDKREPVDSYPRVLLATCREDAGLKQHPSHPALLRGVSLVSPVVEGACQQCQPPSSQHTLSGFPQESWAHLELGPMPNFGRSDWPGLGFHGSEMVPQREMGCHPTYRRHMRGVHQGPWRPSSNSWSDLHFRNTTNQDLLPCINLPC